VSKLANTNVTTKVVGALKRAGFESKKAKGSKHMAMIHPDGRHATIPRHRRIKVGLLRLILKQIEMDQNEFLQHYR